MDVSKFFVNWPRLWMWVVTPLLLRLLVTFGAAYFYRPAQEELDREQVYSDVIAQLEVIEAKQENILALFRENTAVPFQEQYLTDVSRNAKRADVQVSTSCTPSDIEGTPLHRNVFVITGSASSLHTMTLFLDMMMSEPMTVLQRLSFERLDKGASTDLTFEVEFEHVQMITKAGGVL